MEQQEDLLPSANQLYGGLTRKQLLPTWIKVFSWIFFVFGILAVGSIIANVMGYNNGFSIYGIETTNLFSVFGIIAAMVFCIKLLTAYGLLWQKDWAVNLAIVDGISGILICTMMMILPLINENAGFTFRLELALLIPYLIKMKNIRLQWAEASKS